MNILAHTSDHRQLCSDLATISDMDEPMIHKLLADALTQLINGDDLSPATMRQVMLIIMHGKCPEALMGAIITALRIKGESVAEITVAASTMLALADHVKLPQNLHAVDIVGTGGDGANLFNISTAATFVAAAAGVTVAKHGSRGVSTSSGASDLLTQAGVNLTLDKSDTSRCIAEFGMGFLFAPNHHPAMRHAAKVRGLLKTRTIFNLLGPLTNPAGVKRSVIGIYERARCRPLAQVLANMGHEHALVVSSQDGLDEFSLAAPTTVSELKHGRIQDYQVCPEDVGLSTQSLDGLQIRDPAQSLALIKHALAATDIGAPAHIQKARDIIAFNAGAAIYVSGQVDSLAQGVTLARDVITSGKALDKLECFAAFTQQLSSQAQPSPNTQT